MDTNNKLHIEDIIRKRVDDELVSRLRGESNCNCQNEDHKLGWVILRQRASLFSWSRNKLCEKDHQFGLFLWHHFWLLRSGTIERNELHVRQLITVSFNETIDRSDVQQQQTIQYQCILNLSKMFQSHFSNLSRELPIFEQTPPSVLRLYMAIAIVIAVFSYQLFTPVTRIPRPSVTDMQEPKSIFWYPE